MRIYSQIRKYNLLLTAVLFAGIGSFLLTRSFATQTIPKSGSLTGSILFNGNFETGNISTWQKLPGGGAQCANYGTNPTNGHARGNFYVDTQTVGEGHFSGRIDLPPSQLPDFPLEACELLVPRNLVLNADEYYGEEIYVPDNLDIGTSDFWGIQFGSFHFQNILGAPVGLQLHNDHVTLALETGSCNSTFTTAPGCDYRSNADKTPGGGHVLPGYYPIPSPMQRGVWHQLLMHIRWTNDSSGKIEVWHRVQGVENWSQTVNISGIPTIQWNRTKGCCEATLVDKIGAYRGVSSTPISVWLDNFVIGISYDDVANTFPQNINPPPPQMAPPGNLNQSTSTSQPIATNPQATITSPESSNPPVINPIQVPVSSPNSNTKQKPKPLTHKLLLTLDRVALTSTGVSLIILSLVLLYHHYRISRRAPLHRSGAFTLPTPILLDSQLINKTTSDLPLPGQVIAPKSSDRNKK